MDFLKKWGMYIGIAVIGLIIFIVLMATGTQMDNIKPGDGFSTTSKTMFIQANEDKWFDTGIKFAGNLKELGATVNGSIFLCSGEKEDINGEIQKVAVEEREVIVPAVQCKGGTIPTYYKYDEFIRNAEPYKAVPDWSVICGGKGSLDKSMNYRNSDIKVSEGDLVEFELIPDIKKIIDCGTLPAGIVFDKKDTYCDIDKNGLTSKQICMGSDLYSCSKKGQKISTGNAWNNTDISRITSDDPSPKGNKWAKIGSTTKTEHQYIYQEVYKGALTDDWYLIKTTASGNNLIEAIKNTANNRPYVRDVITQLQNSGHSAQEINVCKSCNYYGFANSHYGMCSAYRGDKKKLELNCHQTTNSCPCVSLQNFQPLLPSITTTQLATVNWLTGSFADFRLSKTVNEVDNIVCTVTPTVANLNESPLINKHCKNYFRDRVGTPNITDGGMFSFYQEMEKNVIAGADVIQPKKDNNGKTNEYAEWLVARVANAKGDTIYNSPGEICITNKADKNIQCLANWSGAKTDIKKQSLRLNYPFRIQGNSPIADRNLQLIIGGAPDDYDKNLGGYNVKVKHSCPRNDGDQLYYYIGSGNPNGNPAFPAQGIAAIDPIKIGDPGTVHVGDLSQLRNSIIFKNTGNDGNLYLKIKDNGDAGGYGNNIGQYEVNITVPSVPTWVSDSIKWLIQPMKDNLRSGLDQNQVYQTGVTKKFYDSILNNGIRGAIHALLILFITVTAISFTIGVTDIRYTELFHLIIKFALVEGLLSDTSWDFLNKYFLNLFWHGTDVLITQFSEFYNNKDGTQYTNEFLFLDKTFGVIFQWQNVVRFLSLFCQGFFNPISWFMFITLAGGLKDMIIAGAKGIILYVTCFFISGFLIALAPIFICFILFKVTKKLFDGWVKQLITNMMMPVIYFAAVGLLNEVLYYSLYQIFNFGANVECMLPIDLGPLKLCLIYFPMPFASTSVESVSNMDGISGLLPVSFAHLIIFIIISKCYLIIIEVVSILPTTLFGAGFMFRPMDVVASTTNAMKYATGMDDASIQRRKGAKPIDMADNEFKNKPANDKGKVGAGIKNSGVDKPNIEGGTRNSGVDRPQIEGGIRNNDIQSQQQGNTIDLQPGENVTIGNTNIKFNNQAESEQSKYDQANQPQDNAINLRPGENVTIGNTNIKFNTQAESEQSRYDQANQQQDNVINLQSRENVIIDNTNIKFNNQNIKSDKDK